MKRLAKTGVRGPETYCLPVGIPRSTFVSVPFKIVQTPGQMIFLYEVIGNVPRQIYLDGRKLPADPQNYTKPFSIRVNLDLLPDTDILETVCAEDEKDLRHLPPL